MRRLFDLVILVMTTAYLLTACAPDSEEISPRPPRAVTAPTASSPSQSPSASPSATSSGTSAVAGSTGPGRKLSDAKAITRFTLLGVDALIDGPSISLAVPPGSDVSSLVPTVVATGVTVAPLTTLPQNFTQPVRYTVAAEDGTTQLYTVIVTVLRKSTKDLLSLAIAGTVAKIDGSVVTATVPFGTALADVVPTIDFHGASISPERGASQDFRAPVTYVVTAEDGSTKTFIVVVNVAPSTAKEITAFKLVGAAGTILGTDIAVTVPPGTNPAGLPPSIAFEGASVSPPNGVPRDFTSPVTYTVTAADGSTKAYKVTVTVPPPPPKDITAFTILGVTGTFTGTSIALDLPMGTNAASLTPTIVHNGASVSPASGAAHDFTSPAFYTVTATDGSRKTYQVTVHVPPSTTKDITSFTLLGATGAIAGTSIAVDLPAGSDVTHVAPTLVHTGASVSPASDVAKDFTSPVTYTVTAEDGSTKSYVVTVNVASALAAAAPKFAPPPGTYASPQSVILMTTTPNSTIFYTLDGSDPSSSSIVYSSPIAILTTKTIRAIAMAPGLAPSPIATGTFTIAPFP